jgi:hypothetical protein
MVEVVATECRLCIESRTFGLRDFVGENRSQWHDGLDG